MTSGPFRIGDWHIEPGTRRMTLGGTSVSLEPKVMDLLLVLSGKPGDVFSRTELEALLWPDTIVGEDTVARAISRLRRAFGDSATAPAYIETISKRGYRLIATVTPVSGETARRRAKIATRAALVFGALVLLGMAGFALFQPWTGADPAGEARGAAGLTDRADDQYALMTRAGNETAITLYERAIAARPDYAPALAGLAGALVQRVVRWPFAPGEEPKGARSISQALERGLTVTPTAQAVLKRAELLAGRAVDLQPDDPAALKALGLVWSAQGHLDRAAEVYRRAIARDPNAWAPMINLGEIHQIRQDPQQANHYFESAYAAMSRSYSKEPQRIGPWQASLGVLIAQTHEAMDAPEAAEIWYRRVLETAPFDPAATRHLAALLRRFGDQQEADRLCTRLATRIGLAQAC